MNLDSDDDADISAERHS